MAGGGALPAAPLPCPAPLAARQARRGTRKPWCVEAHCRTGLSLEDFLVLGMELRGTCVACRLVSHLPTSPTTRFRVASFDNRTSTTFPGA